MGAIYVNDRYLTEYSETFPMYQGWWGNNNKTKFMMKEDFDPALGADSFKLSNPSPVLNAMLMSSLEVRKDYLYSSSKNLLHKQTSSYSLDLQPDDAGRAVSETVSADWLPRVHDEVLLPAETFQNREGQQSE